MGSICHRGLWFIMVRRDLKFYHGLIVIRLKEMTKMTRSRTIADDYLELLHCNCNNRNRQDSIHDLPLPTQTATPHTEYQASLPLPPLPVSETKSEMCPAVVYPNAVWRPRSPAMERPWAALAVSIPPNIHSYGLHPHDHLLRASYFAIEFETLVSSCHRRTRIRPVTFLSVEPSNLPTESSIEDLGTPRGARGTKSSSNAQWMRIGLKVVSFLPRWEVGFRSMDRPCAGMNSQHLPDTLQCMNCGTWNPSTPWDSE